MKSIIFAMAICALSSALMAQDTAPTFPLKTFDHTSYIGAPPWTDLDNLRANVEVFQNKFPNATGGEYYIIEFIPKGESFEAWTQLFALNAETEVPVTAIQAGDSLVRRYEGACTNIDLQVIVASDDRAVFSILCGQYVDNPAQGEFAMFRIERRGSTLFKNYYHQRVPAFDANDRTTFQGDQQLIIDADEALVAFDVQP